MELVAFRIVQEYLTNIHRHSGAKSAFVRLTRTEQSLCLDIEDLDRSVGFEAIISLNLKSSPTMGPVHLPAS